jgi:hypothetical protein
MLRSRAPGFVVTLLVVFAPVLLAGCSYTSGGIAPSTIPLTPGGYTVLKRVHGRDCQVRILGVLPVSGGNETRRAVESAMGQALGATALVNVTSDTFQQFWVLFTRHCTEIFGTAVSVP